MDHAKQYRRCLTELEPWNLQVYLDSSEEPWGYNYYPDLNLTLFNKHGLPKLSLQGKDIFKIENCPDQIR